MLRREGQGYFVLVRLSINMKSHNIDQRAIYLKMPIFVLTAVRCPVKAF